MPIRVERSGRTAWVTIDRPEARNALLQATCFELAEVAEALASDDQVGVVVLSGAGDRAFCAGADLKERRGISAEETEPYINAIGMAIKRWARLAKPTIAAINGFAFGGGMELALACDFRLACASAEFALTEVRLGIIPGAGGTQRLPRLIGVAAAKELIMLGRRIDARRAHELGLVMNVVEADELAGAVTALVDELAGCAPLSVAMAKEAIDRGVDVDIGEGLRIERTCYNVTLFSDDRDEGLRAFAEKRPPRYLGT
jgi:methylglutaconyl-CoA hydratase